MVELEDIRISKLLGHLSGQVDILEKLLGNHMCKCLGLVQG